LIIPPSAKFTLFGRVLQKFIVNYAPVIQHVINEGILIFECSKMGKQIFKRKSKVVSDDDVESVDQKCMKDDALQFQKFLMNIHKFQALFSLKLSQARLSQVLREIGSKNAYGCARGAENDFSFDFSEQYYEDGIEFHNHVLTDGNPRGFLVLTQGNLDNIWSSA
jgi:hypothetical protein